MYDLQQLLAAAVAAAFGSVGLWTFGGKLIELIWKREETDNERLRAEVRELKGEVRELRAQHGDCEARLAALEHHHASLIPRWIKDSRKRIVWLNSRALISIFAPLGLRRDDVEGHSFQDLLDFEAARVIDGMDADALANPGKPISSLVQLHPQLPKMHVVKIAGVGREDEVIYEGCAFPVNDPQAMLERGTRRMDEQRGLSMLRLRGPENEPD